MEAAGCHRTCAQGGRSAAGVFEADLGVLIGVRETSARKVSKLAVPILCSAEVIRTGKIFFGHDGFANGQG